MKHINGLLIILLLSISLVGYAQTPTKNTNDNTTNNQNNTAQTNNNDNTTNNQSNTAQTNKNNDNNSDDEKSYLTETDIEQQNNQQQKDPYEKLNRAMFQFNEDLDYLILKPIAKTYNAITPSPVNTAVDNVFNNLTEIPTVINDLLQFNFYQATSDSWRFVINSTVGIGGILDVAKKTGLSRHYEDFGLTLARWGWKDSNYLVIPFLNSSTIRDGISLIPYYYMTIYPYIRDWRSRYAILAWRAIDIRAQLLRFEKVYRAAAIDRYVLVRSAYLQRRRHLINQNKKLDDPYTAENTQKAVAADDDNEETYYLDDV
ncbi:MAG: VacJ family lipoprotein [Gammaproteobacteria bacterium]